MMKQFEGNDDGFKVCFAEFIRVLQLFTDCIITHSEFMDLIQPVVDREILEELKNFTLSR